jgi:hypothetical protein
MVVDAFLQNRLTRHNKMSVRLSKKYGILDPPTVDILPHSRCGKCCIIGFYSRNDNKIYINKHYLGCVNMLKQYREILKHELMHAVSYQRLGIGGHGKHFKDICKEFDLARCATARCN